MKQAELGQRMLALIEQLYPLPRSITGGGLRQTLEALRRIIPIEIHEVPTGTPVLDWTVPREWVIREAWVKDPHGTRILDFRASSLHVVGYSVPVHAKLSLADLQPHLHSLPDRPGLIPYRTSYYSESWGFCLSHEQRDRLPDGLYEVYIDSELREGSLSYGELVIPGTDSDEILISAHVCHPALANDNLSGIAVAAFLAAEYVAAPARHTLRFLFAPGTIGSLTWLSRHRDRLRVRAGLVLAGVGDAGSVTYKRTRDGHAEIDRIVALALRDDGRPYSTQPYSPWGYDERQYNSPGFKLPVGLLMRTPHGTYPEYHTSGDDLMFVRSDSLVGTLELLRSIVLMLGENRTYENLSPYGEPQLGRRGLYASIGGTGPADSTAMLWVLNLADGQHTLADIAEVSGVAWRVLVRAVAILEGAGLLRELPVGRAPTSSSQSSPS